MGDKRHTRQHIRRIDTRPGSRADVKAGVSGAHLGMRGELLGGYTPGGAPMGTKSVSGQMGGGQIGLGNPRAAGNGTRLRTPPSSAVLNPTPGTTATTDPNRPGGKGGGDPLGQLGGLDRWYQMNPTAIPGKSQTEAESRKQGRHRENMRRRAEEMRIAAIQGRSPDADMARSTGMAMNANDQPALDAENEKKARLADAEAAMERMEADLAAIEIMERRREMEKTHGRRLAEVDPAILDSLGMKSPYSSAKPRSLGLAMGSHSIEQGEIARRKRKKKPVGTGIASE